MQAAASMPSEIPVSSARNVSTLQELCDLEHPELVELYKHAAPPAISALSGDLRGRMLAVLVLPDFITRPIRALARTDFFPWRGKSFRQLGDENGEGINRIIIDALKLFRFETRVTPSRHDGQPAVELNYDLPENPFFIRAIEDEIRELRPGLFLGQAWLRLGMAKHFVLWFGLEKRDQE